jgi:hypothetical protein
MAVNRGLTVNLIRLLAAPIHHCDRVHLNMAVLNEALHVRSVALAVKLTLYLLHFCPEFLLVRICLLVTWRGWLLFYANRVHRRQVGSAFILVVIELFGDLVRP